jgi:hypothetical protein
MTRARFTSWERFSLRPWALEPQHGAIIMSDLDIPLLPSVLDRLLDDRPDVRQDPARSRGQNGAISRRSSTRAAGASLRPLASMSFRPRLSNMASRNFFR